MVECQKCLDPTSYGLFLVAFVSLPIALVLLIKEPGNYGTDLGPILMLGGALILIVSMLAFKADSNFGFIVFGLVGVGVFLSGFGGLGFYGNITLVVVYLMALVWSFAAHTPKLLSFILITTALIFLFQGLGAFDSSVEMYGTLMGIAALANFVLAVYLAFALALDSKLPVY